MNCSFTIMNKFLSSVCMMWLDMRLHHHHRKRERIKERKYQEQASCNTSNASRPWISLHLNLLCSHRLLETYFFSSTSFFFFALHFSSSLTSCWFFSRRSENNENNNTISREEETAGEKKREEESRWEKSISLCENWLCEGCSGSWRRQRNKERNECRDASQLLYARETLCVVFLTEIYLLIQH